MTILITKLLFYAYVAVIGTPDVNVSDSVQTNLVTITIEYEQMSMFEAEELITEPLSDVLENIGEVTGYSSETGGDKVAFTVYTRSNVEMLQQKLKAEIDVITKEIDKIGSIVISYDPDIAISE